jgi:Cu(I)/Ag(I) efflux system periplasmic protein CusF
MGRGGRLVWLSVVLTTALSVSCRQRPQAEKFVAPSPQATTPPVAFNGPPGYPPPVVGKPYPGTGVVVLVNLKEGWLEINHEEIKDLMPPMQMEWSVKDRSLLKAVRAGDRVEFTVVETGGGEVITELKRVSQSVRP